MRQKNHPYFNGLIEETRYFSIVFQNVIFSSNEFNPHEIFANISKSTFVITTSNSESFYIKNGQRMKMGQLELPISKDHSRIGVVMFSIFSITLLLGLFLWDKKSRKQTQQHEQVK